MIKVLCHICKQGFLVSCIGLNKIKQIKSDDPVPVSTGGQMGSGSPSVLPTLTE